MLWPSTECPLATVLNLGTWITAVVATDSFISVWPNPLLLYSNRVNIFSTGYKVLQFYFDIVCFSVSSLGLIYSVISLL